MAPYRKRVLKKPLLFGIVTSLAMVVLLAPLGALALWWLELPTALEMVLAKAVGAIAVFAGALAATLLAYPPRVRHGLAVGGFFALLALLVALFQEDVAAWQWLTAIVPPLAAGGAGGLLGRRKRKFANPPLTERQGR